MLTTLLVAPGPHSLMHLEAGTTSIDEVANRVGFTDPNAYRRHFRTKFLTTPSAYRRAFEARADAPPA